MNNVRHFVAVLSAVYTFRNQLRLASFVLLCIFTIASMRGEDERQQTGSSWILPDSDAAKVGSLCLTPPPGNITADLSPNLPMSLSPASSDIGRNSEDDKAEWLVAPVPFLKPTFGWGVGLAAGCIYQPLRDQVDAPAWVSGVGGFYTQNKSWGIGGGHKMNLDHDNWRLSFGGGYADLYYDFYGIGSDAGNSDHAIALNQQVSGGKIEALRRIARDWYGGIGYLYANSRTRLDSASSSLPQSLGINANELQANIGAMGLHLQRDSRDSQFFPTRGALLDVTANLFDPAFGSDFTFQAYELDCNQYLCLATNHVLALRGYGRFTSGRVPYFALCSFGSKGDLRGYTPGRYRDKMMLAAQAEYRWRITERLGAVAFAGIGGVAPQFNAFDTLLPSGGVGVRYVIAKRNNISLRFDTAWGKNEHAFYFGIGEAF